MTRIIHILIGILLTVTLALTAAQTDDVNRIHVPTDYPTIGAALAAASEHAEIVIDSGEYQEALLIDRPLALRAVDGAEVLLAAEEAETAILVVNAEDVTISGLSIVGGRYGIDVFLSENVTIEGNSIRESKSAGIRARMASVVIRDNIVSDIQPPYGRGIYLANTMAWPPSEITGNTVSGSALSGIQTNLAGMVTIADNVVTRNGLRGIAVTEMSHANVFGNLVSDNIGSGIYVLDMSMALVCDNSVRATGEGDSAGMRAGNGITIDFHSEVVLSGNSITDSAQNGISVLYGSSAALQDNVVSDSEEEAVFVADSAILPGQACRPQDEP